MLTFLLSSCRYPARFQVLVCLYHIAQGGALTLTADLAGVSPQLLCIWRSQFSRGIALAFTNKYMPVPTLQTIAASKAAFKARRGIADVAYAVDGTHVPFKPPSAQVSGFV